MRIVSEVSREMGRMYGPQFVASGVAVARADEDGMIVYVVSGTAAKMSEEQLGVFKREEKDESVAVAKPNYLLFGMVAEPGERVEISDEEGGRAYDVDNSRGRTDLKRGLLLNLGPANSSFRYAGKVTARGGATSDFEIVSGDITLGD